MLRYSIIIMIIVSVPGLLCGETALQDSRDEIQEYEALSVLITAYYGIDYEVILVNEDTEPWCISAQLVRLKRKWKNLKYETIDSLIVRNSHSMKLKNKLLLDTDYVLLSCDKFVEVLQDSINPNWDKFDKKYPDTPGYITVSRVGFDSKYTQALIYYCNAYRCGGTGIFPKWRNIAYLIKEDDTWVLKGTDKGYSTIYNY